MDEAAAGDLGAGWPSPVTIIVWGSAISVTIGILSGTSPMRGLAGLPLALFDHRQRTRVLQYRRTAVAFAVDSIEGAAAGYKDLTATAGIPSRLEDLAGWVAATVLNPSHALFREDGVPPAGRPPDHRRGPVLLPLGCHRFGAGPPKAGSLLPWAGHRATSSTISR